MDPPLPLSPAVCGPLAMGRASSLEPTAPNAPMEDTPAARRQHIEMRELEAGFDPLVGVSLESLSQAAAYSD